MLDLKGHDYTLVSKSELHFWVWNEVTNGKIVSGYLLLSLEETVLFKSMTETGNNLMEDLMFQSQVLPACVKIHAVLPQH